MNKNYLLLAFSCITVFAFAQTNPSGIYNDDPWQKLPLGTEESHYHRIAATGGKVETARVEPPNWWVGMQHPTLEILIYDQDIRNAEVAISYTGVQVLKTTRLQNPNYLFVEIKIGPGTKAGKFPIVLTKSDGTKKTYPYELRERKKAAGRINGLDASDFIYLIMPDRFANGDPGNDSYADMAQVGVNRQKIFFRHGGDLVGVMEHLDYLEELGVTAIWLNPVLENNQPYESYHGYAVTDNYKIDRRFGSNEQYVKLAELCQARGIKLIKDVILNHLGDRHWLIRDLPDETWVHQFDEFTKTNYRAPTLVDPYAAESDRSRMSDGWFDHHMPDLNQQQVQLANYLIQSNIWWVEYAGIDAYRIDTYPYPDQKFMAEWGRRLQEEFPTLSFFGEIWDHGIAIQAHFTQDNGLREYNTFLQGCTDFQMNYAIQEAVTKPQGWTDGAARLYYVLTQDFLYKDPFRNVLFLDNHDLGRFFLTVGKDIHKFKSGLTLLLTQRGIPSMYYGTEMLLTGIPGGGFGEGGRLDFPGGWKEDTINKFEKKGRTAQEKEVFDFVKKLANYRKNTPALHRGKLMQFVPENSIYVYFRYDSDKTVMVILNANDTPVTVPTARYRERTGGFSTAKNVLTDEVLKDISNIAVDKNSVLVLELGN